MEDRGGKISRADGREEGRDAVPPSRLTYGLGWVESKLARQREQRHVWTLANLFALAGDSRFGRQGHVFSQVHISGLSHLGRARRSPIAPSGWNLPFPPSRCPWLCPCIASLPTMSRTLQVPTPTSATPLPSSAAYVPAAAPVDSCCSAAALHAKLRVLDLLRRCSHLAISATPPQCMNFATRNTRKASVPARALRRVAPPRTFGPPCCK